MKKKTIAIIPARGGSKRIKGKNLKNFNGAPIISKTIKILKKSRLFDKIIVSTDSKKIKKIALESGALVPFIRPRFLSDDFTSSGEVIKHCIKFMEKKYNFKYICCVYPCNPFLKIKDLHNGYKKITSGKNDFIFSATEYQFPFFRSFIFSKKNGCKMVFKRYYKERSQDLNKIYSDAGQFYWGTKKIWLSKQNIYSKKSNFILIPKWRYHDIDTPEDWVRAEKFSKLLKKH